MHDVAIVGGGAVGMLLAVLLAQDGHDVVVVEARDTISQRPRAIGIHPPAVEALAEAGVDVAGHGRRIVDGVAMADGRELGRLRLDGVFTLAQQEVERMLRARLATLHPDALVLGERVLALRAMPGGRQLVLDGGGPAPAARLVVAADGTRSAIRAAVGVGMLARGRTAHYVMADVDGDDVGDRALLCFEREGVVESFPLPGGRRRWVALVPESMSRATFSEFAGIVRRRTGHSLPGSAAVSAFTARQSLATSMVAGDVVLIGDAAHEISPIGGQGLNLGWLDARALAATLRSGRTGLERFNAERMRSARRASAQAGFNMGMGRALVGPMHASRAVMIRALAVPPVSRRLADAFTMRGL